MNDRFLRALEGVPVDATPVWFMRQAGRYLPEYRELRAKRSLIELMQDPELSAEVSRMPVERFDFDAAVLFNDLSFPLYAAGLDVTMEPNLGPVIHDPIRSPKDLERLKPFDLEGSLLGNVLETIRILKRDLRVPLVGFAGAPFTLATYAIEGKGARDMSTTRRFMVQHPEAWHDLLRYFADVVATFLKQQAHAGADAVQLFDSWVGVLNAETYRTEVMPHSKRVFDALSPAQIPSIHFGTGNPLLYPLLAEAGGDAVSVDWRVPLDAAWAAIGHDRPIQGNLDPAALLAPADVAVEATTDVLERAGGRPGHIFNLGHGILPQTPVDVVELVVETVHNHPVKP